VATTTNIFNVASSGAVGFRDVFYLFPTSQGSTSTVLVNDGNGRLSWDEQQWTTTSTGIFYTGGNVGIGVVSPGAKLHLAQAIDGDVSLFILENSQPNTSGSTNETAQLRFGFGGNTDAGRIVMGKLSDFTSGANSDSFMSFSTSINNTPTEFMRLREGNGGNGVVLLGHTAPVNSVNDSAMLQLHAVNIATPSLDLFNWRNDAGAFALNFVKSRSFTPGTGGIVQNGDLLGSIIFGADDGTFNWGRVSASIEARIDATPGGNDVPGRLIFSTAADGASNATERMRIDSNGRIGIGTQSPSSTLHVLHNSSSTFSVGSASRTACIMMGDSDGNGVSYITVNDGVLSATTTKPSICQ